MTPLEKFQRFYYQTLYYMFLCHKPLERFLWRTGGLYSGLNVSFSIAINYGLIFHLTNKPSMDEWVLRVNMCTCGHIWNWQYIHFARKFKGILVRQRQSALVEAVDCRVLCRGSANVRRRCNVTSFVSHWLSPYPEWSQGTAWNRYQICDSISINRPCCLGDQY